jgi:uncharacterized alpha-E superfamily protein
MLSRIADSFFWMHRYVERADGILRMLKVNYASSLEKSGNEFSWKPVLRTFTYLDESGIEAIGKDTKTVLQYMIEDKTNPNSIANLITRSRENARGVQDQISIELWECINEFYHNVRSKKFITSKTTDIFTPLSEMLRSCFQYYGTAEITMPRDMCWTYMGLGKFLERAIQTTHILEIKFSDISYDLQNPFDIPYWRHLLRSVSGYQLYLRTYRTGMQTQNVVTMLVLNTDFPRSILYSLVHFEEVFKTTVIPKVLKKYNI